jgi:hypothetical protein
MIRARCDGRIGDTRVDVYRVQESADETFLHNVHRVGTVRKPAAIQHATERQLQVQTILRIKVQSRGTSFRSVSGAANELFLAVYLLCILFRARRLKIGRWRRATSG